MAPKGGRKIKAHFDRAEAEYPDAETRAKLSERSEFLARRIMGLKRGDPPAADRSNGCLFFCYFSLEQTKKSKSLYE